MNNFDASIAVVPAWRVRFEALIQERMRMPFAWGSHDCCLFAADATIACSGFDPAEDVRGTYSTAQGAVDTLKALGGLDVVGARIGEECLPLGAQVGDCGLVSDGEREMLGVCLGPTWVVATDAGLGVLPFGVARKAWRTVKAD